jgi:hypothetical protein
VALGPGGPTPGGLAVGRCCQGLGAASGGAADILGGGWGDRLCRKLQAYACVWVRAGILSHGRCSGRCPFCWAFSDGHLLEGRLKAMVRALVKSWAGRRGG